MGFFKSIGRFFGDIIKDIVKKLITFGIIIFLILIGIRYVFGFNPLSIFFGV